MLTNTSGSTSLSLSFLRCVSRIASVREHCNDTTSRQTRKQRMGELLTAWQWQCVKVVSVPARATYSHSDGAKRRDWCVANCHSSNTAF